MNAPESHKSAGDIRARNVVAFFGRVVGRDLLKSLDAQSPAERRRVSRAGLVGFCALGIPLALAWLIIFLHFGWTSQIVLGAGIVFAFTIGIAGGAEWARRRN